MANRNLADEVDALAKGLASLRVANKRTVSRIAALEDRELQALKEEVQPSAAVMRARQIATNIVSSYEDLPPQLKQEPPRQFLWQRIRAWWVR